MLNIFKKPTTLTIDKINHKLYNDFIVFFLQISHLNRSFHGTSARSF